MISTSTTFSDNLLIVSLKNGDERAFETIYQQYFPKLFIFSLKICKSKEMAEEIVHDVFIKVWDNREHIDPNLNFKSYLYKITKNHLLNFLRKRQPQHTCISEKGLKIQSSDYQTEQEIIFADYLSFYNAALSRLSLHKKQIFLLNRQHGLSYKEIASELRLSEKTIEFHMKDCLKVLKTCFRLHTDILLGLSFFYLWY